MRLLTFMARWVAEARAAQQDALREMQALDAAVAQHMAHGAMAGHDPLTDSILQQLDVQDLASQACAPEGAQPPTTTGAGLTQQQLDALRASQADDWWLDWLMPTAITVALLAYGARVLGLLPVPA